MLSKTSRTTLYHVTDPKNRASILKNGLAPWSQDDNYSYDPDTNYPYIWFWDDKQKAIDLAANWRPNGVSPDIWTIDGSGIHLQEDPHGPYQRSFATQDRIPPDRLLGYEPYAGQLPPDHSRSLWERRPTLAEYITAAITPKTYFTFEKLCAMQHQAAWADVAAKAKRLVQDGQVTILRNAPQHIMAHVIGDHGEYDVEISRHDPSASIIEQWQCECPWNQYAFDRTRKWKHLEGRVCSHTLAAYWKAKSTPLDTGGMEPGAQVPMHPGQKPGEIPGQEKMPGMESQPHEIPDQRLFQPEEQKPLDQTKPPQAPPQGLPATTPLVTGPQPQLPFNPAQPPSTPVRPQLQQLQLFDITAPPGAQPVPGATPVSVPGGRPPTPGNPVQFPGTFSHFLPIISLKTSEFIYSANDISDYIDQYRALGQPIYVTLTNDTMLELSGGKIPMPGAQPYDVSQEGVPLYRVVDLGYNPATGMRENADVNALQGAPEQTGTYADVSRGKRAEVIDFDHSMKMAYVVVPLHYEGQDVRLHPHSARGWCEYADLRQSPMNNPWRRGR